MNTAYVNPNDKPTSTRWVIAISLSVASAALVIAFTPIAFAQADKSFLPSTQRYQISAWASGNENVHKVHGCYIIDTLSGELWLTKDGGAPKKLAEKLK